MTDISSISFESESFEIETPTTRSVDIEMDRLLSELGFTLAEVKDLNGMQADMYFKMAGLVRQTQNKLVQLKQQNVQNHRKCLQHIEILLFQQDYSQALAKIDQYKKIQLTDLSFQQNILQTNLAQNKQQEFTFEQAKMIIQSQFAELDLKQRVWLQYALENQENEAEDLEHVTFQQIQAAQLQHFRRQFSINSQISQPANSQVAFIGTPQKKISKSISYLKSQIKKQKTNSNLKQAKNKQNEKSAVKLGGSPKKRSSEKRTTRKKISKQQAQPKTSKKSTTPFLV